MEPVFDKEMDAVLRHVAAEVGTSVPVDGHIDADAVAAFVENVLPQTTRTKYITHFADCDDCRNILAAAIGSAEPVTDTVLDTTPTAITESTVPWYRRLFSTPILAYGMGAMVLGFGAIILYQSTLRDTDSLAQLDTSAANVASAPIVRPEEQVASNKASVPSDNELPTVNETAVPSATPGLGVSSNAVPRTDSGKSSEVAREIDGSTRTFSPPPPPPPAVTGEQSVAGAPTVQIDGADERKLKAKDDAETSDTITSRQRDELPSRRDLPPAPAKSGPTRSGPAQSINAQTQNSQPAELSAMRRSGGRTFQNRNGVWTDSAYNGQQLTLVRRGSDDFKKLDAGLRSIANEITDPVIVVWKGKGYRIN